MKLTRKLLSVVLSLLLIISMVMIVSTAANAASGDTIYFEKPENWDDTIYIYYWEGSGSKPSSLYDYEFTHVSGNIYSYTCKASFSKFLIDDGQSGKHQTVDLDFPGDGYICKVLSTGRNNGYGNYCNDAEWSKFEGVSDSVSVSASPKGCDFMNSIDVTLGVTKADRGTYSINGATAVSYTNGTKITLGENANVGDKISLTLMAGEGNDSATETYVYTKTSSPVASSIVYFDNSAFNWDEVYLYSYGTAENAEWPGEKMQKADNGLYYYTFSSKLANENIIVNNGKEDDEKQQYPANSGLPIKKGECKYLTADKDWVDYGTPDGQPAGFAYTADKTSFKGDTMNVKIGLKNAVKGTYQIDGGTQFEYTDTTVVSVGQGAVGNKDIKLTLTATSSTGDTTSKTFTYRKTFTPSKTTFSSSSDGHTTEAVDGKYSTNPNMQLGKNKTITVDGNPSDWDSSMIIAQGVANDDPRVYMPSAMHEQPWDDYALYAAWDNDNLYFMWEMANTTYVVSPSDNFAASKESRPWRNSIPMYIALSVDPKIHADGTAWGTDKKSGAEFTNPFVWGCVGGTAKDGGVGFKTNVDTLIAFDTNNSNGGSSIFKADKYDAANDNYMFNYDTAIPIGVTSFEKQDNQNGFKIAKDYGTLSDTMIGVGGAKGSHTVGDSLSETSNWVDFFDLGYKNDHGFIYEVAIPLKNLGIDKSYIESKGIGAMQILTYGTSGMDCLPYDAAMQDNADVEYSYDPSTSHEKEDVDTITVPLARVGALLSDTVVKEAPFEVNFGADKAGTQGVGSDIKLIAEAYNGEAASYSFTVNGSTVQNSASDTYNWKPTAKGTYDIGVTVTSKNGKTATASSKLNIGDEPVVVTEPPTTVPKPTVAPEPTESPNPTGTPLPTVTPRPTDATETGEAPRPTETGEAPTPTGTPTVNPNPTDDGTIPNPSVNPEMPTTEPVETSDVNPTVSPIPSGETTPSQVNPTVAPEPVVTTPSSPTPSVTDPTEKITSKKTNPVKVTAKKKTVKAKKLKKAKKTVKPLTVKKAQGTIKITKVKKGTSAKIYKKIKVNRKTGAITFKKGKYAKKTYKIKLRIYVKGNSKYKSKTIYKVVKIKVK
ncbi:MAG: starch-binding protein [Ruminococcus sp.]|nr:starch-binding protein [Ruminococcus sp.]